MGIFSKEKEVTTTSDFEKFWDDFCAEHNIKLVSTLEKIDIDNLRRKINNDSLLKEILNMCSKYVYFNDHDVEISFELLNVIYDDIVRENSEKEINLFKKTYYYFLENSLLKEESINIYCALSVAYSDKSLVLDSVKSLVDILDFDSFTYKSGGMTSIADYLEDTRKYDNLLKLYSYPSQARQYYIDDRSLLSSFISLLRTDGIRDYMFSDSSIDEVINKKLKEDAKQNGIYDIDRGTLAEISNKLDKINDSATNLQVLIDTALNVIEQIKLEVKAGKEEINNRKLKELEELQNKATNILQSFNTTYLNLLNQERESLASEKSQLFQELDSELAKRKVELLSLSKEIASSINIELGRVNTVASSSVKKIEDFINNNEMIKQMVKEAHDDQELLLSLKEIRESIKSGSIAAVNSGVVVANDESPNLIVPNIILASDNRKVDNTINYYFDERIPFDERFGKIQEIKNSQIKNGKIYHERFDDMIKFVMLGYTPYMYGPSGCGKTYMIENQLSQILDMNVITQGYVLYEQDIIGYTNAGTGSYVPSNFYRCYKYGDIIFLDELDAGIANATVVLNRFLGVDNKTYTFPDGINTKRHSNFRIITSGNTNGSGRTLAHNTRQKMDESVNQRIKPIYVSYDNRIEERILKDYKDWYYFGINFRKAIEKIPVSGDEVNTIGTFTTRDAESIKNYLDNKVFDARAIIQYEFIETKDMDTLTKLLNEMSNLEKQGEFKGESTKILSLFNTMIREKKGM